MKKLLVALFAVVTTAAAFGAPETNATLVDAEANYTKDIEKRTEGIISALSITETNKAVAVHDTIMGQWRALRAWHDANDAKVKKAKTTNELAGVNASLKTLHNQFIAKLSKNLTPEQVTTVKDKMTYGVVQVTYNAYVKMYPEMTDVEKKQIMDWLVEARETSMDQGSSNEKHAVFGKYKGRINNYLSKQGYDAKTGKKKEAVADAVSTNSPAK